MENKTLSLLNEVNRAIIKFRGIYSMWSKIHKISYNEMLILYTIREMGFCTQKQICDNYLLPRQTINNVITGLRKKRIIEVSGKHSFGREKAFVLTKSGEAYAKPLLNSLDSMEAAAVGYFGENKLYYLTEIMLEYYEALNRALEESR